MGLTDKLLEFSDLQAITVDADSTDVIDLGTSTQDLGPGSEPMSIKFHVGTAFDSAADTATLTVNVATGAAATLGTTLATSGLILEATLVADYEFYIALPPSWAKLRYFGIEYDNATEAFTAGTLSVKMVPTASHALSAFA